MTTRRSWILGLSLWLAHTHAHAEGAAAGWALGGGALGESIAHPGALLVAERTFDADGALRPLARAELGGYWHPRASVGVFLDAQVGLRRVSEASVYSPQIAVGVGVLHSFIAAETVNFPNRGRPAVMPVLDLGLLGFTLRPDDPAPLQLTGGLRVFGQRPVNTHGVIHPALTLTLTRPL